VCRNTKEYQKFVNEQIQEHEKDIERNNLSCKERIESNVKTSMLIEKLKRILKGE
jgi:hypothetical protein